MEIVLGKTSGFCGGVIRSVVEAENTLNKKGSTYCLGELVHNKQVVGDLEEKGLVLVNSLNEVPNESRVIIRAHGVAKDVYELAKEKNIDLIDLTCLKVIRIHELATSLVDDYFIVLVGKKDHPETIGTKSFCGVNSTIVDSIDDLEKVVFKIYESKIKKVAVIAQTTYSMDKYDKIVDKLQEMLGSEYEVLIKKTICNATELRQREMKEIASNVDAVIIIGGKHSSNTVKLYDIASSLCNNSVIVETAQELVDDYSKYEKVGVMAGASTPQKSIDEVLEKLGDEND